MINDNNTVSPLSGDKSDNMFRTSKTHFFDMNNHTVSSVNKQICNYMHIENERSEDVQGHVYNINDQFKRHSDSFVLTDPSQWEENRGPSEGQRTWSIIIYLSDVEEGGETIFFEIPYTVKPLKGRAIMWYNLNTDGSENNNTAHAGLPVLSGSKYILTKWFRTRGSLSYPYTGEY
jgi:prolyl 4-hydroxylase